MMKISGSIISEKKADGKENGLIINNVRNKLIHRIFALVRNKQLYQLDYTNPLDKKCSIFNVFFNEIIWIGT
jgi:hypothetical protein